MISGPSPITLVSLLDSVAPMNPPIAPTDSIKPIVPALKCRNRNMYSTERALTMALPKFDRPVQAISRRSRVCLTTKDRPSLISVTNGRRSSAGFGVSWCRIRDSAPAEPR